ncbi:MAG: hypothetical protein PVH17_03045 [Anaerolineae bacterium]
MIDALRVVRFSLRDYWDEFVWLILLNLLWTLVAVLPLVPLFALGNVAPAWVIPAGLLLALPLPIVSGALCFVTNQVSRGKAVDWQTFVQGVRRYWLKSLIVAGINLIALILIAANLQFYSAILQGSWTDFALSAWLVVGIYWLLVQVFWFSLILELKNESVLLALRNALAMVIVTPGFTLTLAVVMVALGALCVVLSVPAVLMLASLFLLIANHATRSRLAYIQKEPYRPGEIEHN